MRTRRPTKIWIAIKSKPMQEGKVVKHLRNQNVVTYCPMVYNSRTRRREPLFPSYLFAQIDEGQPWAFINHTHGVLYVLTSGSLVSRVPSKLIADLIASENSNGVITLPEEVEFFRDQELLVTDGPFKGHIGKFLSCVGSRRVELLLQLLGTLHKVSMPRRAVSAHQA